MLIDEIAYTITTIINPWHMFLLALLVVGIYMCRATMPSIPNGGTRKLSERGRGLNWASFALAYLWIAVFDVPLVYSQAGFRVVMFLFVISEIIYNWNVVKTMYKEVTRWLTSKVSPQNS